MAEYVLVVRDPAGNETEYDLVGEVVLGRDDSAGIQLPDPNVSRKHARLFLEDGFCYIEDLGSSNGTLIDGQPVVGAVVLEPGREATIGPFAVFVEEPEGAGAPPPGAGGEVESTYAGPAPGAEGTLTGAAPVDLGGTIGSLEGLSGVAIGQYFEVGALATVGRVPGNDIVVEDPSVSRKHAELNFDGEALTVRDLGSSNGTFVNEAPADGLPLEDGDVVRFGEVEFRFAAGPALSAGAGAVVPAMPSGGGTDVGLPQVPNLRRGGGRGGGRSPRRGRGGGGLDKRKKLLLFGGGGLVLLLVIGVAMKHKKPPPPPQNDTPTATAEDGDQPGSLAPKEFAMVRRAKALMDSEQWDEALKLVNKVIDMDPINKTARQLRTQIKLEQKMQELYNDAERKSELGDNDEALARYIKIDHKSSYYQRARYQVRGIVSVLMKRYLADCKGNYHAYRWKDAASSCAHYMDFSCQCPGEGDSKAQGFLDTSQRNAHVAQSARWHCPSDLNGWVECKGSTGPQIDVEQVIHGLYSNPKIRNAVTRYYEGDVDHGMTTLDRLRKDFRLGHDRQVADELYTAMKVVQGKFTEGQADLLGGDTEGAQKAYDVALSADQQIFPATKVRSFYRKHMYSGLVGAYTDQGNDRFGRERWGDAFSWYQKAAQVDALDPRVKAGFQQLENQAARMLRNADTCEAVKQVLDITLDDPPSPTHKQAQAVWDKQSCGS